MNITNNTHLATFSGIIDITGNHFLFQRLELLKIMIFLDPASAILLLGGENCCNKPMRSADSAEVIPVLYGYTCSMLNGGATFWY
jgi:hypothetical protein